MVPADEGGRMKEISMVQDTVEKKNTIYVIDVTNRDGVQTSQLGLAKIEKTIINMYLDEMGIFQSEAGFPTTNHETNYLRGNLQLAETGAIKRLRISGWLRAIKADMELAKEMVP